MLRVRFCMLKKFIETIRIAIQDKRWILFVLIFALHVFFRFYDLEGRSNFGWDQVDNAWVAKNIIVDHKFPLEGMQAKGSSGIFIGPLYYYFISIFYFFTNLDPIASGIFAGATSIFSFLVLFYVAKRLFTFQVALIAVFLNTVSFPSIVFDRVQWPVNFIPGISLLILYILYRIGTGNVKYMLLLGVVLGFSFNIHFTSIFFPFLIILALPFFPRTKEVLKYAVGSILIFFSFLISSVIVLLQNTHYSLNVMQYGQNYYHGFHFTRVMQLINDAFIEFESFFTFGFLKSLKFLLVPLFVFIYFVRKQSRDKFLLTYLICIWFLVPWIIFATYSGEISNYYFSINKFVALLVIAFLLIEILKIRNLFPKLIIGVFLLYYFLINISKFFGTKYISLSVLRSGVKEAIKQGKVIEFTQGDPNSYLYYIYTQKK